MTHGNGSSALAPVPDDGVEELEESPDRIARIEDAIDRLAIVVERVAVQSAAMSRAIDQVDDEVAGLRRDMDAAAPHIAKIDDIVKMCGHILARLPD